EVRKEPLLALASGLLGLLLAGQGSAHHAFSAEFEDTPAEISGVVTSARYSNPHPRYQVEVTMADGSKESWELQGSGVTTMSAGGWDKDFVAVGDQVRVWGSLGRNGAKKLFINGLEKSTGETYPQRTTASV